MTTMKVEDYLSFINVVHDNRGGIDGQRDVMKTTTARRIRERMVVDLKKGATIPPVVIGLVLDSENESTSVENSSALVDGQIINAVSGKSNDGLSIIDGMQRTRALRDAAVSDGEGERTSVLDRQLRVEFWITNNVQSMIYRMLVLNTGQVPWTVARQLEVIYKPLLHAITENVPDIERIVDSDNKGRRVAPGQYAAKDLIELYLAFSSRKTTVETKEVVSQEYERLDLVDNLSNESFQDFFYAALGLMVRLDKSFGQLGEHDDAKNGGRFIFDKQTARIGFMVAIGIKVLGRPSAEVDDMDKRRRLQKVIAGGANLVTKLSKMRLEELGRFLRLDVLTELLNQRVSQVGRYERSLFQDAFKVLMDDEFEVQNMEVCWRANT